MNTAKLKALALKLRNERSARWQVEESEEYQRYQNMIAEAQKHIESIQEKQKELFKDIPDSTAEYEEVKRELLQQFKEKDIREMDGVTAKMKRKQEVDTRKLMHELEGDYDNFFLLARVTQKDLKQFEKDNEDYKGLSKKVVDVISEEIVDLDVSLPD